MQRFGALDQRFRARVPRGDGNLRLPKPVKSATLAAKPPGNLANVRLNVSHLPSYTDAYGRPLLVKPALPNAGAIVA
jgi:hypothetical protein